MANASGRTPVFVPELKSVMARSTYGWEPELPFWKQDGDYWWCEKADLEAAVAASGITEEDQRNRMGHGYRLLSLAADGVRLTKYEVNHVELGLDPNHWGAAPLTNQE